MPGRGSPIGEQSGRKWRTVDNPDSFFQRDRKQIEKLRIVQAIMVVN